MKKYLNISLIYAVAAMAGGVFYREFTKWNTFSGVTALGKVHTHLFLLGMLMFMIVALFARDRSLSKQKTFRIFTYVYNIGVTAREICDHIQQQNRQYEAFGRSDRRIKKLIDKLKK